MMHLVLFDIDGTLLDSNLLEADCFIASMEQLFGIKYVERDWGYYRHVTDSGIARQLVEEQRLSAIKESELIALEKYFLDQLTHKLTSHVINAMPGAPELLTYLLNDGRFAIGFATGSFKSSAQIKLANAQLNIGSLPLASCNDHYDRIHILRKAIRKAQKHYHTNAFKSVTYVGDGFWDYQAAKALDLNFIGINNTSLGHPLSEQCDVEKVVPHFHDIEKFIHFLLQDHYFK